MQQGNEKEAWSRPGAWVQRLLRLTAFSISHTASGMRDSPSTTSHSTGFRAHTWNTDISGGMSSTDNCRAMPTKNALFMAGLEVRPMRAMDWRSLRTSKAWKSWQKVRVAKAMVLAVASAMVGSLSTYSPSQ